MQNYATMHTTIQHMYTFYILIVLTFRLYEDACTSWMNDGESFRCQTYLHISLNKNTNFKSFCSFSKSEQSFIEFLTWFMISIFLKFCKVRQNVGATKIRLLGFQRKLNASPYTLTIHVILV